MTESKFSLWDRLSVSVDRWRRSASAGLMEYANRANARANSRIRGDAISGRALVHAVSRTVDVTKETYVPDLPEEFVTESGEALRQMVEARVEEWLPLQPTNRDLHFVGRMIQVAASIEQLGHQLRYRLILAGVEDDKPLQSRSWKNLSGRLERGIKRLDIEEWERNEHLSALAHINRVLPFRDLCAHWLIKPVPEEEASVFVSLRDTDSLTLHDEPSEMNMSQFVALAHADLERAASELETLNERLCSVVDNWRERPLSENDAFREFETYRRREPTA